MYRRIIGTTSLVALLALVSLAAPAVAQGQDAQQNETDLAFIKRMSSRLQGVERQAEQLEKTLQDMSRYASQSDFMGQDQYGRQTSGPKTDMQSEYRNAERKMRSTGKRAEKKRDELAELQRSGATLSEKDREKIDRSVTSLERKVSDMERIIHQRRL